MKHKKHCQPFFFVAKLLFDALRVEPKPYADSQAIEFRQFLHERSETFLFAWIRVATKHRNPFLFPKRHQSVFFESLISRRTISESYFNFKLLNVQYCTFIARLSPFASRVTARRKKCLNCYLSVYLLPLYHSEQQHRCWRTLFTGVFKYDSFNIFLISEQKIYIALLSLKLTHWSW